jgi:hypothetical protein
MKRNLGRVLSYDPDVSTEARQIAAVRKNIHAITKIKNPSEAVQLAAVEQYTWAVGNIANPFPSVQVAVVKKCPYHIAYINDPVDEAQIIAMSDDARNIQYMKTISEKAVRTLMAYKFEVFLSGQDLNPEVMKKIPDEGLRREISNMVVVRDVHHR